MGLKGLLLSATILTLAGGGIALAGCAMNDFDYKKMDTNKYVSDIVTLDGAYENIYIKQETAKITLAKSDDSKTHIEYNLIDKAENDFSINANTLTVSTKVKNAFNISWFNANEQYVTIYLPELSYSNLTIENDTGSINVDNTYSFNEAFVKNDTGAIYFDANVKNNLKVENDTGKISINNSKIGNLEANGNTGSIELTNIFVDSNINISNDTGKILLNKVNALADVKIENDTGRIELTELKAANLTTENDTGKTLLKNTIITNNVIIESDTGSVEFEHSDANTFDVKTSTGSVKGSIVSPKIFNAISSTGNVNVPDSVTGGICKIKTSTGSINITIDNQA